MVNSTDLSAETPTPPLSTDLAPPRPASREPAKMREVQDEVSASAAARKAPGRLASALERARVCARIASDNRAKDILLLDLRGATALVDFFVIATATSRRLGNAIAIEIDQEMKRIDERKLGIEGSDEGRWTLLDYGDFVVHVFSPEARTYYGLEEIWGDAPRLPLEGEGLPEPSPSPVPAATSEAPDSVGEPLIA